MKWLSVNAINPKVILCFLAFTPQFVDSEVARQIAQLAVLFAVPAIMIFGAIGWFAGSVGERLARRHAIDAWLERVAGGIVVAPELRLRIVR